MKSEEEIRAKFAEELACSYRADEPNRFVQDAIAWVLE